MSTAANRQHQPCNDPHLYQVNLYADDPDDIDDDLDDLDNAFPDREKFSTDSEEFANQIDNLCVHYEERRAAYGAECSSSNADLITKLRREQERAGNRLARALESAPYRMFMSGVTGYRYLLDATDELCRAPITQMPDSTHARIKKFMREKEMAKKAKMRARRDEEKAARRKIVIKIREE